MGSMAFKMTEIVAGSIYSQLNIQDGDIIEGINGSPYYQPQRSHVYVWQNSRDRQLSHLTIRRNGASQNSRLLI
jgi:C-terminal processing protease CtpA/Prc